MSDFQRNPKGVLGDSKNPTVLTVNGKPAYVLQDAESYQMLLDKVHAAEDLDAIREGLIQSMSGQGRLAQDFFSEFEKEHGL